MHSQLREEIATLRTPIPRKLASQLLTLYTTPVVYLYLARVQNWLKGGKREQQRERERLRVVAAE